MRRARKVKIRIAASVPATFAIAGEHYRFGTTPRTITVRIGRDKQPLRLRCSLRSAGGTARGTYVAFRG